MIEHLLKYGNHKLPDDMGIWVLSPIKTCPGRTKECEVICYALKAEIQYGDHVKNSREKNFRFSRWENFVQLMHSDIKRAKKAGVEVIRIHEGGDFYNQVYIDKWIEIARKNPDIQFFTYTRSWMLDFRGRSENLIVFYSIDATTKHPPPKGVVNLAETVNGPLFFGEYTKKETKACWRYNISKPGTCRTCNYCYSKDGDEIRTVGFVKH